MAPPRGALGLVLLVVASASPAAAQTYPTKAVTLVVPFPAGGRTDLTGRVVAQFLRAELGQPIVVWGHYEAMDPRNKK